MGWIGDSMGWKSKSMGCFGRTAAWTHKNLAKRRTKVGVRFNGLPYSAHAAGDVCRKAAADALTAGCGEKMRRGAFSFRPFLLPFGQKPTRMKLSSLLLCAALLTGAAPLPAGATDGHVCFATNPATGAIASLSLAGDTTNMNWMLRTDGSQYAWVTPKYGWGLGYFSIDGCTFSWQTPTALADGGRRVEYVAGGVRIEVERSEAEGGFAERFTFVNEGAAPVRLTDMGIYTPFNDNYPDARTCLTERCHAHIWPGGAAAYVEAQRMSGRGSEVGLMLTQGNVVDYDIWERGPERANSNFRGVVALCPADTTLGAGGLCLFAPDGRASCAYLAPRRIDGRPGHYYDPFANDQDWALAFYLLVEHGI